MADTTETSIPMNAEQAAESLLAPEKEREANPEMEADGFDAEALDREPEAEGDEPLEADAEDSDDFDQELPDDGDDQDDTGDDEEEPLTNLHTVKVNGETKEVTLDELKRGYSGQQYIQQGMERNAQQEKSLTQVMQQITQERQHLFQMYQRAQQTGFIPQPQPPSTDMARTDPIGYVEAQAQFQEHQAAYQQQQNAIQQHLQSQQQQESVLRQRHVQEQLKQLIEAVPELGDPKKAPEFRKALVEDTQKYYNIPPEVVMNITDKPVMEVLIDGLRWRRLKAGQQAAKNPRENPTAVTQPRGKSRKGTRGSTYQKAVQRAAQSQSTEDWASALLIRND